MSEDTGCTNKMLSGCVSQLKADSTLLRAHLPQCNLRIVIIQLCPEIARSVYLLFEKKQTLT
jgi:hypothetical protein